MEDWLASDRILFEALVALQWKFRSFSPTNISITWVMRLSVTCTCGELRLKMDPKRGYVRVRMEMVDKRGGGGG